MVEKVKTSSETKLTFATHMNGFATKEMWDGRDVMITSGVLPVTEVEPDSSTSNGRVVQCF